MSATTATPRRRLSIPRLLLALVVLAGAALGGVYAMQWAKASASSPAAPWFAGYADVTATPTFGFESPQSKAGRNVVLAFIVSDADDACTPSWGSVYTLDEASVALDLDRRVARLEQQGGEIAVSFGGQINDELATHCSDRAALTEAYESVIERYDLSTIDIDLEGDDLRNTTANDRRAEVLAAVQRDERESGGELAIWLTLPIAPSGLDDAGIAAVRSMLGAGVDLAGVNAMTMNYGASMAAHDGVLDASTAALKSLHRQLDVLYREAGFTLADSTLWSKIGATPMIGQNDLSEEVFTLDDAVGLNEFVLENGVGRMSMWSLNRDTSCGSNYVTLKVVSVACSGVDQGGTLFADLLGAGLKGKPEFSAANVTKDEPVDPSELVDDPATSPYPIWNEASAYLQGTKIVWHRTVYEAKWWTRGDLPDNPVLKDWETPWLLIGPVLPGEEPIPQATLPAGTYPEWSGLDIFNKGDRVLFEGTPFQAKWWNQGESPEASSSDPDSSAWVPLTQKQIEEELAESPQADR